MRYLFTSFLIIALSQNYVFSQAVLNGGFENNSFPQGCLFGQSNSNFNAQIGFVSAFGSVAGNDIIRTDICPALGQPNSGNWNGTLEYLNNWNGQTGRTILSFTTTPLISGNQYTLTYFDKSVILNTDYITGTLSIWVSAVSTGGAGTSLVATSTPVQDVWTQRSFTFTAVSSGTAYVIATVSPHTETGKVAWVHVDDFALATALPVELSSFNCEKTDGQVTLNWVTASERYNEGFEVQHSNDGATWSRIGFVEGIGTSDTINNYRFINGIPSIGINYYRLKQIDFDGTVDYSKVISVFLNEKRTIEIYPNPTNGLLKIVGIENGSYKVMDNVGRTVKRGILSHQSIDIAELANGVYLLHVVSGDQDFFKQLVKN